MKVSYAQNAEDVMLHRALGDRADGFYVDVGAHDPTEYSVTRFFYDRGWRGINVEPVKQHYEALLRERPADINLNVAAGAVSGDQAMFVIADTGLSTFVEEYADAANKRGFAVVRTAVAVQTLDEIVGRIEPPVVHFLKIDVEGAEAEVLRGIGFERFRPWIVLAEATRPGTQELAFEEWEPLLTDRGYTFAWFDGLNRFYVANERAELKAAFSAPPNVFDGFIGARQFDLESQLATHEAAMAALRAAHDAATAAFHAAQAEAARWRARAEETSAQLQTTAAALEVSRAEAVHFRTQTEATNVRLEATATALDTALVQAEYHRARAEEFEARFDATAAKLVITQAEAAHHATRADDIDARLQTTAAALETMAADYAAAMTRGDREAARADRHALQMEHLQAELSGAISTAQSLERDLQATIAHATGLAGEREGLVIDLQTALARIGDLQQRNDVAQLRIDAILASRSWRVTAPMRAMMRWAGKRP